MKTVARTSLAFALLGALIAGCAAPDKTHHRPPACPAPAQPGQQDKDGGIGGTGHAPERCPIPPPR